MRLDRGDLAVGVTVLLAALLALGAIVWLSPAAEQGQYVLYGELDDVTGLENQAPVYLRGYTIGRVTQIKPRLRSGKVVFSVKMTLEPELRGGERLHLPEGTSAKLSYPPFLGSGFMLLELPDSAPSGRMLASGARLPCSRDQPMSDNMQMLTGTTVTFLTDALQSSKVLMDSLTTTAAQAHRLLLASDTVVPQVTAQLAHVSATVDSVTLMLRSVNERIVPTAAATMDSAQRLLGHSNALLVKTSESLDAWQPRVANILANLDSTTFMAKDFVAQVSAKPLRVLTGVHLTSRDTAAERARQGVRKP